MLYEALVGRRPFEDQSIMRLLTAKQQQDPPPIAEEANLPIDLTSLSMRLLARNPSDRPDVFEIAKAVLSNDAETRRPAKLIEHQLVGRQPQLTILETSLQEVREHRRPLSVFINGRSGEGKSSLAECFLEPLRRKHEVVVLSGRCYDRETVPFKALDTVVDTLCSYIDSLPEAEAALLVPDDIGVLTHVFPVMQRVKVVAKAPRSRVANLDEQQIRKRAFVALRELLWRISDRMPVIMFVDDLQWGDADSATALFEVLRPPEEPVLLFLGSFRNDETEQSRFLNEWEALQQRESVALPSREVGVGPLSLDECVELVLLQTGKDNDAVRRRAVEFFQETGGNPFFLCELVDCFDPETDSFEPVPLSEVIARKLKSLPSGSQLLLEAVAVSGQASPVEEVSKAAGYEFSAI